MKGFLKEKMKIDSFIQSLLIKYVTARIDIKNVGNENNSIEVISNSDLDAKVNFPGWFQDETGSGLTIQSDKCFLYLELKCINDGTLNINLKGIDTRDKNDKRFPIYIDYMKLAINDEDYLNNNKLVCHDKPYKIKKDVTDGEIIKLYVEWLPFNDLSNITGDCKPIINNKNQINKELFKKQLRGSSGDVGKTIFLDWVLNNVNKDEKILDVGFGSGVYGKILKSFFYKNIDGVDIWDKNIEDMGLNYIYDNIFIEDILNFEFDHYDLIIMGDVLEHISLEDSKKLLNKFINGKASKLFIQVPYMYENHNKWYGNPNEVHIQDEINEEYMEREFPFLELIKIDTVPYHTSALGRKTGKDTYCATYVWFSKDI